MNEMPHVVCPWDRFKKETLDFSPLQRSQETGPEKQWELENKV